MDVKEATKRLEELRKEDQEVLNETYDDKLATAMNYAQALDVALNALTGHAPDPSADVSPAPADETRAEQLWDDDRRLFVRNLGCSSLEFRYSINF